MYIPILSDIFEMITTPSDEYEAEQKQKIEDEIDELIEFGEEIFGEMGYEFEVEFEPDFEEENEG